MASATAEEDERLVTGYSGRIVILIAVGTTAAFIGRNIFGPLLPSIIEDLAITPSQAGFALTVMFVAIAATQYPGGRLADQLTYKTVIVAGIATLIIGFGLIVQSSTYVGLLVGAAVMGLGGGLFTPSSYAQLADLFEERRGQAFGIYTASIDTGGTLSGAVAAVVLAVAVWRAAFLPSIVLLTGVLVAMHAFHRGSYETDFSGVRLEARATVTRVLGIAQVRWALLASILVGFTIQGVVGFLPAFLQNTKGFSPTLASNSFIWFFFVGVLSRLVAGRLGDQFDDMLVAAGVTIVGAVGLAILNVGQSLAAMAVGIALLAFGLRGFWPVTNSFVFDYLPDDSQGGDYGAFRSLFILVGSIGPSYTGFLAERAGYITAFTGLIPVFVGAFLVSVWLAYRY